MCAEKTKSEGKSLETVIAQAVKKIGARKENDICRYLPSSTGGYIHHFTMRKMKTEAPEQLIAMVSKYIVNVDKPTSVAPKQRAARGSRKRRDQFLFNKLEIEQLLHLARAANNKEMVRKIDTEKRLTHCKTRIDCFYSP